MLQEYFAVDCSYWAISYIYIPLLPQEHFQVSQQVWSCYYTVCLSIICTYKILPWRSAVLADGVGGIFAMQLQSLKKTR